MKFHRSSLAALLAFVSISSALAYPPLRDVQGLAKPVRETVLFVPGARVVLADYGLIRRDFPETLGMSEMEIDAWLLHRTAYVSRAQAAQVVANTPIAVSARTVEALRPSEYGRALVFEAGPHEFIDAKGVGAKTAPRAGGHVDGLATLGESTREFLYEKLVRTVLVHAGSSYETVEHYAVIDLGFDVKHADGTTSPAGEILRQAHQRSPGQASVLADAEAREVELTLRRYGLTSAGAYRQGAASEQINIQGTPDHGVLDFGGYLSVENFDKPARNFFGFHNLLEPGQVDFVQPEPRVRVPFRDWGYGVTGVADPKLDNPWIWSHELARDFRAGRASRGAFGEHFDNLVGRYRRGLALWPGAADAAVMDGLIHALGSIH